MSAIAGIIGRKSAEGEIEKVLTSLKHRGPYNSRTKDVTNGQVGVAEQKQSVESTAAMSSQDGPLVLLDGELYNSRPQGQSDVDMVRDLYLKHGKECFGYLDGVFACAIFDKDETILARDPLGPRACIYGTKGDELYFASEAKALIPHVSEVDEIPTCHYYSTKEGIKKFKPFIPDVPDFDPDNPEEIAKVVKQVMIEGVERSLADGSVGAISFSGGLDSSIIAGIAKDIKPGLPYVTATMKSKPGPDKEYSKRMADKYGLDYHLVEITNDEMLEALPKALWHLESFDEDCIFGWIANYFTARKCAEFSNCVLVGETADELFGGYLAEFEYIESEEERQRICTHLVDIANNTGLRRMDRGWHANGVTPRAPFIDPSIVAASRKIPMKFKYYDHKDAVLPEKWILRAAFEDENYIPNEITWRPKLRFSRGVGVDALMNDLLGDKVSEEEFSKMPTTPKTGIKFYSEKERHFYDLFVSLFPASYENLCVRWDPFYE